ncbi:MAG: endopeptidase La [SAR86 cluster bacterium]|jgi:ATP-dependent Lon protease|nr:endopeptidase La [SAR86 cluster bacterium]
MAKSRTENLPLLPLRDVIIFPSVVTPLFVGREKSIVALQASMAADKQIMLVAQKDAQKDNPTKKDIYEVGTIATILQLIKLPDGTVKVLVEGNQRAKILEIKDYKDYFASDVLILEEETETEELKKYITSLRKNFQEYVKITRKATPEVLSTINSIDSLSKLSDTLVGHLSVDLKEKQEILETVSLKQRSEKILSHLASQLDLTKVEKKIRGRVKKQMEKSQKEYYLNEQMKALKRELGELDDSEEAEVLEKQILEAGMSKEAQEKALNELQKYKMMSPMSAEASVVRGYIDWMLNIPWKKKSRIQKDLSKASDVLNEDHHALEEVKERILEYLAVQKRVKKLKGPVLCLVGPPGVGKTSLGESIARATNRKFIRMSLGGVRDEAEIRGHRRTYIGSMPGRILQKLSQSGVKNPLFLLDEVDKMGMDFRGDPASALIEVLDPEQNHTFNDHYLEVDYDLSDIMFVCTANTMNIPPALLDRMEVIRIPGYTEDEKVNIADQYLIPKQMKNNGLKRSELEIPKKTIIELIRHFSREAGVRQLERDIAKICRKVVKNNTEKKTLKKLKLGPKILEDYCGVRKFEYGETHGQDRVGQVTGLAWTQVGGELLTIEAACFGGKGKIIKTGSLGDVMQESIQAAMSVVRSRAVSLEIDPSFYENQDVHIHVPEGATPKDGPSAGIGMCTAVASVLSKIPVRADVAMTGEITLRGEILKIGGLKEKLLAARRGGIKTVLIPKGNVRDLKEVPENIKEDLEIKPVQWIDEVLDIVLTRRPVPWQKEEDIPLKVPNKKRETSKKSIGTH